MLVVGGGTAAALTLGVLAVAKAQSDDPPKSSPATTNVVVTTDPGVGLVTTAAAQEPATSVASQPATSLAVTVAPTTTALLPSGVRTYAVTSKISFFNAGVLVDSIPAETTSWVFTGPCDGVGQCSITAGGPENVEITLAPGGNGKYTSTFNIPQPGGGCVGTIGTITVSLDGATLTGDYLISGCDQITISGTFTGKIS